MRQVVLDTETTGIGPEHGHRIIEIGCVEVIDRKVTGEHYHVYINPQREVDEGAFRVHGISDEFLADKPLFADIIDDFIRFVDGAELIIHNAPFDVGFLNHELKLAKWGRTLEHHCKVLDTLVMAKQKHPGQKNNLDALCKRYEVDNSNRELHGALLDAEILAFVYLAMTGGQISFIDSLSISEDKSEGVDLNQALNIKNPIVSFANDAELQAHQEFVELLVRKSGVNLFEETS